MKRLGLIVLGCIGVAIVLAAAVSIPRYLTYIKKSKTTEARIYIKHLHEAASRYYMEYENFPNSVGPTPKLGACCKQGGQCAPDAQRWTDQSWKSLRFRIADNHYYSYSVITSKHGFTARANGDLDCDGTYSTFEMRGESTAFPQPGTLRATHRLE